MRLPILSRCVLAAAFFFSVVSAAAAPQRGRFPPRRSGPWNQDLYLLQSRDGVRFARPVLFVEGGGVASIVRDRGGRLVAAFQWFPAGGGGHFDRIAVKVSTDDGRSWSAPQPITLRGMPSTYLRPCDPTLVCLDDGRIRMYFTSDPRGGRSGAPSAGTYSAVSTDGLSYRFEPGVRFQVPGLSVLDCAVVRLGSMWHYYAPVQGNRGVAYHAASADGLTFRRFAEVDVPGGGDWLGCAVTTPRGLCFYGSGGRGGGVWSATSSDGTNWTPVPGVSASGADPGVVGIGEGRYFMIATGPKMPVAEEPAPPPLDLTAGEEVADGEDVAIAATARYVFVYRDGMLHQFEANTLKLLKSVPVPGKPERPRPFTRQRAGQRLKVRGQEAPDVPRRDAERRD